jgi:hypothetical protein
LYPNLDQRQHFTVSNPQTQELQFPWLQRFPLRWFTVVTIAANTTQTICRVEPDGIIVFIGQNSEILAML